MATTRSAGSSGKKLPDITAADDIAAAAAGITERNLSHEAAARMVGVSVKAVGRWASSETEPRNERPRRLTEVFGEAPPLEMTSSSSTG